MVQIDNNKNTVRITNNKSSGVLILSATSESFSLSLESQDPDGPAPNLFCIDSSSDEYHPFMVFFSNCYKSNNSQILLDESKPIEHAPILMFSKHNNKLILQFAVEEGYYSSVKHFSQKGKVLTKNYYNLFKSLQHIKHECQYSKNYHEMAMS